MINKYFRDLEIILDEFNHIVEYYNINKQIFTAEKGSIDGEIYFYNSTRMDFLEVVNTAKTEKQKYSYHYMGNDFKLIFRYDNAKNHKEVKTFPHHKHIKDKVIASNEKKLSEVLSEIEKILTKSDFT